MDTVRRKAYMISPRAGNMNNLKLIHEDLPEPGEDEVCVRVKAIGLNFADIFAIFGLYSATPRGSFIPGLEYSGEVISTGKKVNDFKKGDKIMGVTRFGGYADHLLIDQAYIAHLPEGWTFEEGAAFIIQSFTAYYALVELGDIKKGQTILIHSAAGGVGILANRIAKKFEAYTIGSIGSDRKIDLLKKEGYDDYIIRSGNFREDLRKKLGGRELNIVLECIGGQIFKDGFRLLAPEGRMIVYGSASYASPGKRPNYLKLIRQYWKRPRLDPTRMIEWNKSVMAFNLIHLYDKKHYFNHYLKEISHLDIGRPHIGKLYAFNELLKAVRLFQTGKTVGKVVIRVP
jgi:alcohol dehydrogenase